MLLVCLYSRKSIVNKRKHQEYDMDKYNSLDLVNGCK